MKKLYYYFILLFAIVLLCTGIFIFHKSSAERADANQIPETNLSNLTINIYPEKIVSYGSGVTENISDDPIFLLVNGSLKGTCFMEGNTVLIPLNSVTEALGVTPKQDGNSQIINGEMYVTAEYLTEVLGLQVEWSDEYPAYNGDGEAPQEPHYPIGGRQVMVSSYPADVIALSEEAAIGRLEEQLMIAYENNYGTKFKPLSSMPKEIWDAQQVYRYSISNLSIAYENDRFFIIYFGISFMVDKYTGTVLKCYNGESTTINIFDSYAPGALLFAG